MAERKNGDFKDRDAVEVMAMALACSTHGSSDELGKLQ
jgi:hypothetical protein